jgi:cobalt-zinc-cadmium efflux system membrane fusion protein
VLPLPGKIVNVFVHLGDSVKQGEPLLTLESPDADAAVSTMTQQQAAVAQAQSAVLKAQKDYDRTRDLREHKAIAEKEVLNAESALAQANAGLEQAQASARQAKGRLELLGLKAGGFGQQLTVRAPISGKVLELGVVPGEFRNDTNAQLMTIADLSTVWVASDVPESDIRFIEPGERLDVDLTAYPGEIFRARVMRIADTVDPITRTVKVRAELANPGGRLRPEMFGRVRHVHSVQRLPVVPAGAVVQGDGQNLVYREVSNGVFEQTAVTTGNRVGDMIGIVSGLEPGQRVVTDGVMLLKSL